MIERKNKILEEKLEKMKSKMDKKDIVIGKLNYIQDKQKFYSINILKLHYMTMFLRRTKQ